MSDPRRGFGPGAPDPNQPQWSQPTEQIGVPYPPVDPAYGGQYTYPSYPPPAPDQTQVLPPYWTQTQYPPPPPPPQPIKAMVVKSAASQRLFFIKLL